ncbi:hypothetical protein GOODEAATRI_022963 [Goodea atripinnis]|uniref:Uncharacterized protein n=1 Tax=Goodea atripinnis TaxID=208336 RepID=A0ABV0NYS5_9TELE
MKLKLNRTCCFISLILFAYLLLWAALNGHRVLLGRGSWLHSRLLIGCHGVGQVLPDLLPLSLLDVVPVVSPYLQHLHRNLSRRAGGGHGQADRRGGIVGTLLLLLRLLLLLLQSLLTHQALTHQNPAGAEKQRSRLPLRPSAGD